MPLWLVILVIGAGACGWVLLKAREQERANTLKKLKGPAKSITQAAKKVARRPSGESVYRTPTSKAEVSSSADLASNVVRELEEIAKRKWGQSEGE